MKIFLKSILLTLPLLCLPSTAEQWRSVATDSQLNYEVTFQGLPIAGQFKRFSVIYSPAAKLLVNVDVGSADMSDDELNSEIANPDWFDTGRFSEATFSSESLNAQSNASQDFIAAGNLNLKGVSEPVKVPFLWRQDAENPGRAIMSGQLTLQRSDFSIGIGDWCSGEQIGIDVSVSFIVHMQRQTDELSH